MSFIRPGRAPIVVTTAPPPASGDSDWITRSTATGVVLADALETSTKLVATTTISSTAWLLEDGNEGKVSLDTSVKPTGMAGSYKFTRANTDTTSSGNVGIYFGNLATFGEGDTFWFSVRCRVPPEFAYQPWKYNTSSGGGSHKLLIMSRHTGSNQVNEVVIQMNYTCNQVNGYWQDGASSSVLTDIGIDTSAASGSGGSASDIRRQPSIDRGVNPLSGNNPDTGSAWDAYEQIRGRYGLLYAAQSQPEFRRGYGDTFSGGFRQVPNQWITYTSRLQVGTWGSLNSRWSLWAALEGEAYELIHDAQNIKLGSGPDYNCLWLPVYVSDGEAGGRKVSSRTTNITGVEINVVGLDTPIGDGVLEYNATTGRFRWHGASESFGTARGYSSANGFLTINVTSGTASDSYLVITVTPASLPSSGTVTDTVTIADGRPDTQANYSQAIISTQAINAPGGFPPTGVSDLADAAAAMASGDWYQMTGVTGLGELDSPTGEGAGGIRTAYCNKFAYDPVSHKFHWVSGDHDAQTGRFDYDEATNTLTRNSVPWTVGAGSAIHGYQGNTWATSVGKLFFHRIGFKQLYRWESGTTWSDYDYSSNLTYNSNANAVEYFPDIDKVMVFQLESGINGKLIGINPDTGAVTDYASGSTLANTGDPHNFCLYNPTHQIIWFGGGNGATTNWKMDSSGTVTALTAIPGPIGDIGPGLTGSLPVYNPTNGKFLVFVDATTYYDFDPSGSGTWTAHTSANNEIFASNVFENSDPSASTTYGTQCCPRNDLGVIVFFKAWARNTAGEMWLYKP